MKNHVFLFFRGPAGGFASEKSRFSVFKGPRADRVDLEKLHFSHFDRGQLRDRQGIDMIDTGLLGRYHFCSKFGNIVFSHPIFASRFWIGITFKWRVLNCCTCLEGFDEI